MSKPEELTPEERARVVVPEYMNNPVADQIRSYGQQVARRCAEIAEEYAKGLSRGGLRHRGDLVADAIRREFSIKD